MSVIMKTLKAFGIGLGASIVTVLVVLLILSFFLLKLNISEITLNIIAFVVVIFGSFIFAFVTSVIIQRRGWLTGMLCGLIFVLLIGIIGLVTGTASVDSGAWISMLSSLGAGAAGGMLGVGIR